MSSPSEDVGAGLLRRWGLPDPGDSKKARGDVLVVGGSRRSPGGAILAGEAALRVGAGRLALLVPGSIDAQIGIALPEAAVFALPDDARDPFDEDVHEKVQAADAVLVGPGFDDADETRGTLMAVSDAYDGVLVLDAFAIGVLPGIDRDGLPRNLILNLNLEEAAILLDRELTSDRTADLLEIADRYAAVAHCYGVVATADGESWRVPEGGPGLGTSGSGDVLAGAITGFAARGVDPPRAAVWASWAHSRAGDRLTDRVGIGFLARDLPPELTLALKEIGV
ncbi:MAG: ADP/ATP-dependent (S)-NAD(P)H-hydrate dehydratase [Microbacterium sp.]